MGSTFEGRLPLATESATPHDEQNQDAVGSLRVLVCDDSHDVRDLVAELLRSYGHEVRTVNDGEAAIREIVQWKPDAALIDIGLPGISGHGVARRISDELGHARPRMIAMTGYGQASDRAAALDGGRKDGQPQRPSLWVRHRRLLILRRRLSAARVSRDLSRRLLECHADEGERAHRR